MQKPNNYDNTMVPGDFKPIELGGHVLIIMDYKETDKEGKQLVTSTGKKQVIVSFDTAQNDRQPGYFLQQFRGDIRPDKKWPFNGSAYITVEDDDGNCSRQFKGFVTSLEKSNPGFVFPWSDNESVTANGVKKKLIGGVFGVEKDWYNGKEVKRHKLRWFRSTENIDDVDTPEETETKTYKARTILNPGITSEQAPSADFMHIPDSIQEELPFD